MPPPPFVDLSKLNFDKPLFDLQEIRRVNPQRHEMEQLSGILLIDQENNLAVGYKDVTHEEFWITGHMPGFPLMPGVILCECAAQLAGFYARKYNLLGGDYLGFGGMDNVRFRYPVFPAAGWCSRPKSPKSAKAAGRSTTFRASLGIGWFSAAA